MSSLRLGLKQSLQETMLLMPEGEKKRRIIQKMRKNNAVTKRGSRPGEPKRKRGRPRKHPRPEDMMTEEGEVVTSKPSAGTETDGENASLKQLSSYEGGPSNSENEFSYDDDDEEDEEEGDDDDDSASDGEGENEEGDEEISRNEDVENTNNQSHESPNTASIPQHGNHHPSVSHASSEESNAVCAADEHSIIEAETCVEDVECNLLKKNMKHSAANKIQYQWKKKKCIATRDSTFVTPTLGTKDAHVRVTSEKDQESSEGDHSNDNDHHAVKTKRKRKISGVVPAPTADVIEWAKTIDERTCREHIDKGLRVKVRFATKIKREGKLIKKKIWYGGRVTAVSKKGTKIKIKYDDGTSEISKFPDEDVVVDAVMNGDHAIPADPFLPPQPQTEMDPKSAEKNESESPSVDDRSLHKKTETHVTKNAEHQTNLTDKQESEHDSQTAIDVRIQESLPGIEIEQHGADTDHATRQEPRTPTPVGKFHVKDPVAESVGECSEMVRVPLMGSPEEGELSPGITAHRIDVEGAQIMEPMPYPQEESHAAFDDPPLETMAASKPDTSDKPRGGDCTGSEPNAILAVTFPGSKSSEGHTSPNASPVTAKLALPIDDVLVDTPISDDKTKRKRAETDAAEDEPPKRKIKVVAEQTQAKPGDESMRNHSETTQDIKNKDELSHTEPKPISIKLRVSQQTAPEITEVDLAPPHLGKRKKKKKLERSKSPKPKPPGHMRSTSPFKIIIDGAEVGRCLVQDQNHTIGTKVGAHLSKNVPSKLPSLDDDDMNPPSLKNAASSDSLGSASRGGRKAAQHAKEKLNKKEKEKDSVALDATKTEKRHRMDEILEAADAEEADELPEWVQCDSCGKWRVLPSDVKVSSLPNLWYCHMNLYDPRRSTCDAPEQTQKQALKERKRAKKKAKRLEAEALLETKKEKQQTLHTPVNSPKPIKGIKSGSKAKDCGESKKTVFALTEDLRLPSESGSESPKDEKKKSKKPKTHEGEEESNNEAVAEPKKPGRKRGRPARNPTTGSSAPHPPSRDCQDKDNVEWVQCEKCEKWRKLPPEVSADELPDTWYCSMNNWNPASASCNAPEDKTDAQHLEIGSSEWQLRQSHAGKYSYRQMIFGAGARKQNRPMSERSRAAESLFVKPVADDVESSIPTTQYSKSSVFSPRTSNFHKAANSVGETSIGIFDILSNSNLWAKLRALEQSKPMKVESGSCSEWNYPKFITYENLPDEIKTCMQEVVLQILGNNALPGDAVILQVQQYPWSDQGIVGFCNADVVINTLLSLVRDGIVEMATSRDRNIPISEWIPKYRRVKTKRALAAEEAIKNSKSMKIAKPWKQREENITEWITGQEAFR